MGESRQVGFLSRDVREQRVQHLNQLMAEEELDAVAVLTPDNFLFLTNFFVDVAPWERPVIAVFPRSGEPFAAMHELSTHSIRMAQERGTLWLDDMVLYSEHPRITGRTWLRPQWSEMVAAELVGHGIRSGRIGVDALPSELAQITALLPGVQLIPIERTLRRLRWVKTAEELELIRQAGALSDWGQERYRENLRGGRFVQELDLFTASQIAEEAGRRFPGQNVELRLVSLRGPDAASPHGTGAPTGARIEEGDGIVNIIIVRLNGLVVENERTWFYGQPNQTQIDAFMAATEAQEAAISKLVAGNRVCEVDAAALAVFERASYADHVKHRTGHGVGTAGHEFPDDMAFNQRPLVAGEVYSAEPGIYLYGVGGFRHDDTVIVGEREPEVVTHTPKDLNSQTIPARLPV
jgi:Xaa-Pro aminopeptidase